jgi:hypothetical protein
MRFRRNPGRVALVAARATTFSLAAQTTTPGGHGGGFGGHGGSYPGSGRGQENYVDGRKVLEQIAGETGRRTLIAAFRTPFSCNEHQFSVGCRKRQHHGLSR